MVTVIEVNSLVTLWVTSVCLKSVPASMDGLTAEPAAETGRFCCCVLSGAVSSVGIPAVVCKVMQAVPWAYLLLCVQ